MYHISNQLQNGNICDINKFLIYSKPPVIFDYMDSKIDYFEKMFKQRNRYYKKLSKQVQVDWVLGIMVVLRYILRKKFQCLRTSWNITGSQMVLPKRRSLVASLLKNSFWRMGELQPVHSPNPYNSSSMPVRFWGVQWRTD